MLNPIENNNLMRTPHSVAMDITWLTNIHTIMTVVIVICLKTDFKYLCLILNFNVIRIYIDSGQEAKIKKTLHFSNVTSLEINNRAKVII